MHTGQKKLEGEHIDMSEETHKPIDWKQSIKLANNKEDLAKEMLIMFMTELPSTRHGIHEAHQQHNKEQLHRHVHKLHGACCYIGVPGIKNATIQLEDALRSQHTENLELLIKTLDNEIEKVIAAYKAKNYR